MSERIPACDVLKYIARFFFILHVNVSPVCMYVFVPCAVWYAWKSKEVIGFSRIRATNTCELPCECWKLSPGSLQKQQMLLTTEPSP